MATLLLLVAAAVAMPAYAPQEASACQARLDGEEFPFLVPEYLVWQEIFRAESTKAAAASLQLSEAGSSSLHAIGSKALQKAAALRAGRSQLGGASLDTAAADLVVEARDDLLRTLSPTDTERLLEHVELVRRDTRYTFAKPGVARAARVITCPISIKGRQEPELVPEVYYWEFHLRTLASSSEEHLVGNGTYRADYLAALRQQHQPIPEADVIMLLTAATETIRNVDAARNASADSREAEQAVAAVVLFARVKLLRALSRESWLVVQRDAARKRSGIEFDFPTSR